MGLGILFFGLFGFVGWAAALGALVYAIITLVRVRPHDWMRRDGTLAVRLLLPTRAYLRLDMALAAFAVLLDLWLVSLSIAWGTEGIFTEDWMGYPGMMDPAGHGYQAGVVSMLHSTARWTAGLAILGRCWITACTQLTLLPLAALWIGSFDTYYN